MKTYVTADLHFGHNNIIQYENRPFNNTEEMDKFIIEQWNNTVAQNDKVYILGDFTLKGSNYTFDILKQLNGTKILILGNHDNFVNKSDFSHGLFQEITPYKEIKYNGEQIVMCHYPIADWNGKEKGAIHLYGHVHTIDNSASRFMKQLQEEGYKCYNVGWDIEHRLFDLEEFTNERRN